MKPSIEASAGTGKTTRVVQLLLERLLATDTEPARLLALTFTVRAANEMRDRLGQWLVRLCAGEVVRELGGGLERFGDVDTARRRGLAALAQLDRVEIGTIHSFASHLLRQYPLEAGVSPAFQEDDGRAATALFRDLWPRWLADALADPAAVAFAEGLLGRMEMSDLQAFARAIAEEGVPAELAPAGADPGWRARLDAAAARAADLRALHAGDPDGRSARELDAALGYMMELFRADTPTEALRSRKGRLRPARPALKAWSEGDRDRYVELRALAQAVVHVDDALVARVLDWLRPFVDGFRAELVRRGHVSFQALIVRAARILRDHRDVREHLKRRFRLILVDEFQDTDPEQSALLLWLAEREGAFERDWRRVEVEPGKLVIVGDPKQSIYLFRGADLEAYRDIAARLTGGDEAAVERLSVNYRAQHRLVAFVNAVGRHTLRAPAYTPLEPGPTTGPGGRVDLILFPRVGAAEARRAEAAALADWIAAGTAAGEFRRADVALLLRALPDAHHYTEALRARGIDFAVEGEKDFYVAQEVVDAMNLLVAIADPTDELAVVGVLRSPLGAVTDRDLVHLRAADAFSPLEPTRVPETLPEVRRLYEAIGILHAQARRLAADELLRDVLARFPLLAIARAGRRADQAVANVTKLLDALVAVPGLTLAEALLELKRRFHERDEEGEAALADEQLDAVRILSIHKAKGLEFPIVVLPDLHRGEARGVEGPVLRAWLTGQVGFRCGELRNRDRVLVEERLERIGEEEVDRLLYVALTRAKERLVLTGGLADDGVFLGRILRALRAEGLELGDAPVQTLAGPGFTVDVSLRRPAPQAAAVPAAPADEAEPDWDAVRSAWIEREMAAHTASSRPPVRRPSVPGEPDEDRVFRLERDDEAAGGRSLGAACHDLLATMSLEAPERLPAGDAAADLVRAFARSAAFREIAAADEVHREVPFVIALDGEVWSGQIDVLYRLGARWIVADWKSDRVEQPARYRQQARIYTRAVQRLLGLPEPPEFRLLYLRSGRSVVVPHS